MFASMWLRQLRHRLFGRPSRSSWLKTPSAVVRRRVRPCLELLEDRLAPSADSVQAVANPASASYNESTQTVQLTAQVKDTTNPSTTVNEGTVQFAVVNSSSQRVGTTATGTVTANGTAKVSYGLPANVLVGSYTIHVLYSDSTDDNFTDGGSDQTAALSVTAASTTTAAANATATLSSSEQDVTLSATVTSSAGTVNEGTVNFTILQGSTAIGTVTSGSVSNGSASVSYELPAGTAAGTYTIEANYSDGSGNFTNSSDTSHTLIVSSSTAAATTTQADDATATFSSSDQDVTLSASVTSSTGTVNEGTVTFTILQGTTVIGTATSGSVSNGSASVSYDLPAGTDAGTYIIEANYSDSAGNFASSSDTTHTLIVSSSTAATTTTLAADATAAFSDSSQTLSLTATVTSSAGTVNEGTVTFTIVQGTTVIGTATSGSVSNGSASVSYELPAGTAAGTYTIEANYSDSAGNFAISSDTSHTLTVSGATTTTTAGAGTATFSTSAQSGTLSATVTSSAGTVDEGTVKFIVVNSSGVTVGTAASGNVTSNGSASVSYGLPAFTMAGSFTIEAEYSDSTGDFADSSGTNTLTISAASTTTTANDATATFSSGAETVTLSARVASSAGQVFQGTVTFTVLNSQGNTIGTAAAATLTSNDNGSVSVSYTLPAFTLAGSYTIEAIYSDTSGDFTTSADDSHTLTVIASSTTVSLTTASFDPNLSSFTDQVTLTAQVSDPGGGTVNEGIVTFTLDGVTGQGNVVNGTATVQLAVPLMSAINTTIITLSYSDPGAGNLTDGSNSSVFSQNFWDALLPSNLTFASDGSEQLDVQMGGQTALSFMFMANGLPTQIDIGSVDLPVTYTNLGSVVLVEIGGAPWQVNFVNSAGQPQEIASISLNPDGSPQWLLYKPDGQLIGALPS